MIISLALFDKVYFLAVSMNFSILIMFMLSLICGCFEIKIVFECDHVCHLDNCLTTTCVLLDDNNNLSSCFK